MKPDPLSIVELIHAVPLGSADWTQVLEQVTLATGSRAAAMVIQDRASGDLVGFHEHGILAERGKVYAEHYVYNDPRIEYSVQHRNKRAICTMTSSPSRRWIATSTTPNFSPKATFATLAPST